MTKNKTFIPSETMIDTVIYGVNVEFYIQWPTGRKLNMNTDAQCRFSYTFLNMDLILYARLYSWVVDQFL